MTWKSRQEIHALLQENVLIDRLESSFSLSQFALNAVFPLGYSARADWAEFVELTDAGREYLALDPSIIDTFDRGDVYIALFGTFYHNDLLVDVGASDLDGIRSLLDGELRSGRLRWPYRFGRLLYDKFNDAPATDWTQHLAPSQVAHLLSGTPQGVHQVGALLSGPLGFIFSREKRYAPPVLRLPLWHCSDTGCNELHHVGLQPPSISVVEICSRLRHVANLRLGPPSEWKHELAASPLR